MQTYKREPKYVDTVVKNYSKFWNQLAFNGIREDKNIFNVDQDSFFDCKNVFVDEDSALKSRAPLVTDSVPDGAVPEGYSLVSINEYNDILVYVSKSGSQYKIAAYNPKSESQYIMVSLLPKNNITAYHISVMSGVIICFNNQGAMVYDTRLVFGADGNYRGQTWRSLENYCEIPVTKIFSGQSITDKSSDANEFTNSYYENYLLTNQYPLMYKPETTPNSITIDYKTGLDTTSYSVLPANVPSDIFTISADRILKKIDIDNVTNSGQLLTSVASTGSICSAIVNSLTDNYILLAINGIDFIRVEYPVDTEYDIVTITDDGLNIVVVCKTLKKVYVYDIGTGSWEIIDIPTQNTLTPGNSPVCAPNKDFISFLTFSGSALSLFAKCPDETTFISRYSGPSATDIDQYYNGGFNQYSKILKSYVINEVPHIVFALTSTNVSVSLTDISVINNVSTVWSCTPVVDENYIKPHLNIVSVNYDTTDYLVEVNVVTHANNTNSIDVWKPYLISFNANAYQVTKPTKIYNDNLVYNDSLVAPDLYSANLWYYNGYYYSSNLELQVVPVESGAIYSDDNKVIIAGNNLYHIYNDIDIDTDTILNTTIYTTNWAATDIVVISCKYNSSSEYTVVPNAIYSGEELYIGLNEMLQITNNTSVSVKSIFANTTFDEIRFNLQRINNQLFTDKITGIINISTSEIAIFFKDKIRICTKHADDTYGFVYLYSDTRLSTGLRKGDSVINTLNGAYTVFPTERGMAIMNYQAYMATADQIIEFASDYIEKTWEAFYKYTITNSSNICIKQFRNYLYITNNSKTILIYDLYTVRWWKFEVPINVGEVFVIDDIVKIVNGILYKFDNTAKIYKDFDDSYINWEFISQRLHFKLPTYFKNIKQLIFQLESTTTDKQNVNVQIKLYRKTTSYKEPELIQFTIDEFRTFVKRFNYWKVNELQWGLASSNTTSVPQKLLLNGISVRYEVGEEVR